MSTIQTISQNPYFGSTNPIQLEERSYRDFQSTLGKKIAQGGYGQVHEVKASSPLRVYKIISSKQFQNGDEIRIAQKVGALEIGPQVHSTFFLKFQNTDFVVIEMDYVEKPLGKHMEDVEASKPKTPEIEVEKSSTPEFIRKIREEHRKKSNITSVEITVPRASLEETLDFLYENKRERFYFELFSKIKRLAENNISYCDTNVGNIVVLKDRSIMLIDFDQSKMHETTDEARLKSRTSSYVQVHFNAFQKIPNLSQESKDLIHWFLTI